MEGIIEVYESKKNALSKMMKRSDYLERNKHRVKLRKRDKKRRMDKRYLDTFVCCAL